MWMRLFIMMTSSNGNIFALLALCAGNSPVPVNSPHKGQWRVTLMFSLICVWINGWVNSREAGDLRRHRGHYDVNVMIRLIKLLLVYRMSVSEEAQDRKLVFCKTLSKTLHNLLVRVRYAMPFKLWSASCVLHLVLCHSVLWCTTV